MKITIFTISALLCSLLSLAQATVISKYPTTAAYSSTIDTDNTQTSFMNVFVVPEKELIVIQIKNLNTQDLEVTLLDSMNKEIKKTMLYQASTIAYFETQTLYSGDYVIKISDGVSSIRKKITLNK